MIYKNRRFVVGNPKDNGFQVPFKFCLKWSKGLNELVLAKGMFGSERYTIEELKQMLSYLIEQNEEYKQEIKECH